MFDSKDIEKYRSIKAPQGLFERIAAEADASPKKARVIGNVAFLRSASAIAACLLLVVTMTFMLGREPSDLYICVSGEALRAESESVLSVDTPALLSRVSEEPMGIRFEPMGEGEITITIEGGELWRFDGEASRCELPYTAESGSTLYWVATEAESRMTLEAGGESVTYRTAG